MLEIKLPWPNKALFPNERNGRDWRATHPHKVKARRDGLLATKAVLGANKVEFSDREPLRITFYMPNRTKRDVDGMHGAIKHHLDGIAKALGVDDSIFRPVVIDVDLDPAKKGFVLVGVGNGAT